MLANVLYNMEVSNLGQDDIRSSFAFAMCMISRISPKFDRVRWMIVALTLLCFLLSAIAINRPSFWVDEKISFDIASQPTAAQTLNAVIEQERRPPAYHLGLWALMQIAGQTERVARLYSVFWAVLMIPATFQLALAFTGRKAAVFAALLAATSPILLAFAQTVRYYDMVAALSALSFAAFFMLLRSKRKPWLAYFVFTLLLLLTDYPAYGVPAAQLAIGLVVWRRASFAPQHPRFKWLAAQVLLALPVLAWMPVILNQGTRDFGAADLSGTLAGTTLKVAYPFYAWLVGETIFPWLPVAILCLVVFGILLVVGWLSLRSGFAGIVWLIAFSIPFALAQLLLGTVAADSPFVNAPARSMACFGLLFVPMGIGLARLSRRIALVAVAIVFLAHVIALVNYYRGENFINTVYNTPAREVAQFINVRALPADAVVTEADSVVAYYLTTSHNFDLSAQDELKKYLAANPSAQVWQVELGRDRTRNAAAVDLREALHAQRSIQQVTGFATQNETYRAIKTRLFGREAYLNRLTVTQFSSAQ